LRSASSRESLHREAVAEEAPAPTPTTAVSGPPALGRQRTGNRIPLEALDDDNDNALTAVVTAFISDVASTAAGALSVLTGGAADAPPPAEASEEEEEEEAECILCYSAPRQLRLHPCGHAHACHACTRLACPRVPKSEHSKKRAQPLFGPFWAPTSDPVGWPLPMSAAMISSVNCKAVNRFGFWLIGTSQLVPFC